jgi:uncharacterized protein
MADLSLTAVEARVLGSLMEKEMTTPEYYPLSLNSLVNACNQKSNRNPVVAYDEVMVMQALDGLKADHLVSQSNVSRVPKYEHLVAKTFNLVTRELAILGILLLRGPQSMGELRSRTERMYAFRDLDEVNETLQSLAEMGLVRQLPRQPGQKEARFVHLFSDEEELPTAGQPSQESAEPQAATRADRIAVLEEEVAALRAELAELRLAFAEFKRQFE